MKKSPSHFRHKKPSPTSKIKLICSFNGAFQPKPPSGTLRYVGGETRIISVDRNIGFSQLVSKISELCPTTSSFSIKYQLPESGNSNVDDTPLVSITTDEDIRCMIEEYDKVESDGGKKKNKKHTRLWVFVCTSSTVDNNNWYVGLGPHHHDFSVFDLGISSNTFEQLKISKPHIVGMCNCEDSLRKFVFKQHESANDSVGCGNSPALEQKNMFTCDSGTPRSYNPLRESVCIPQIQTVQNNGVHSFVDSCVQNMSDFNIPVDHFPANQNFGSLVKFNHCGDLYVEANQSTGCGGGGNIACCNQSIATMPYINALPMSSGLNLNPGWRNNEEVNSNNANVMPHPPYYDSVLRSSAPSCNEQFVEKVSQMKSAVFSNKEGNTLLYRSRNHRNGGLDMRNQRTSPYHIRSHRGNLPEVGNYHGVGIDGKTCSEKCCNGLRPSSNIFKHGQAMRSNYTQLWKPWSSVHDNTWEGMVRMMESTKPTLSFINAYDSNHVSTQWTDQKTNGRCVVDNLFRQDDHVNHLGYHNMVYTPPLACNFANNQSTSFRVMNTPEALLRYPNHEKSRIESECMIQNVQGTLEAGSYVPLNGSLIHPDLNKEPSFLASLKDVDFPGFSMRAEYNTDDEVNYDTILPTLDQNSQVYTKEAAKTTRDDHKDVGALSSVVTLDFSLHKLSLSSSKSARAPTSSLASNDISEYLPVCEVGAQQNLLDLMDEGHFSSGPLVEKSSGDTSNFSVESAAVLRNNHSQKDNSQGSSSNLVIDEKADSNESRTCPKVVGGIYSEHVALCSHLATRELQTIKNSDLEDIRELGSGTYGTVYYGKWKGSDVAIKRIKPSCFSGSKLEEDRLIADFWKEAHILGQLHHPNVVSLYGVVKDGPATDLATVTEYMVNGSLKQVLQRKDRTIDRRKRLLIAMDAAIGMEYLHEKNIVHFDLKSHNFLVNMRDPYRPVCKIGDMGLSKVKRKTLVSAGIRGTIPWMAPELLTSENNMVTEKVDVYSFGIVMWELLTGEEPYAHLRPEETIAGIINGDLRPEVPSWCDPMWRSLMERCWSSDPDSRPSFSEIAKELRSMVAAMNVK